MVRRAASCSGRCPNGRGRCLRGWGPPSLPSSGRAWVRLAPPCGRQRRWCPRWQGWACTPSQCADLDLVCGSPALATWWLALLRRRGAILLPRWQDLHHGRGFFVGAACLVQAWLTAGCGAWAGAGRRSSAGMMVLPRWLHLGPVQGAQRQAGLWRGGAAPLPASRTPGGGGGFGRGWWGRGRCHLLLGVGKARHWRCGAVSLGKVESPSAGQLDRRATGVVARSA
jgi:hypothetical protein